MNRRLVSKNSLDIKEFVDFRSYLFKLSTIVHNLPAI